MILGAAYIAEILNYGPYFIPMMNGMKEYPTGFNPVDDDGIMRSVYGGKDLYASGRHLFLVEDYETAVFLHENFCLPTWIYSTNKALKNIEKVPLPMAGEIVIFIRDDDDSFVTANKMATRWSHQGFDVKILRPIKGYKTFHEMLTANIEDISLLYTRI